MEVSKRDWKLYRKKLPDGRSAFVLNKEKE